MNYRLSLFTGLFLFFLVSFLYGSDNLRIPDIRSMSMGRNGVTQSSFFNPSLISISPNKNIQLHYLNQYGLKELGTVNACLNVPNNILDFAFHVSSFGYDEYRESMFRISFSKPLHKKWILGIGFHYEMLQTDLHDEVPKRIATDIGLSYLPVDKLLIGIVLMNAPHIYLHDKSVNNKCFTGYVLQAGFQWQFINNMLITASVINDRQKLLRMNLGMEYIAFQSFYLRAGIQSTPLMPSFGVGYDFFKFSMDITSHYHSVLGVSTGVGLSYFF